MTIRQKRRFAIENQDFKISIGEPALLPSLSPYSAVILSDAKDLLISMTASIKNNVLILKVGTSKRQLTI